MQVGLRARALFVDEIARREAVETVGTRDLMRLVAREQMREAPARGRRRLESAVAPAGIEIQALRPACGR